MVLRKVQIFDKFAAPCYRLTEFLESNPQQIDPWQDLRKGIRRLFFSDFFQALTFALFSWTPSAQFLALPLGFTFYRRVFMQIMRTTLDLISGAPTQTFGNRWFKRNVLSRNPITAPLFPNAAAFFGLIVDVPIRVLKPCPVLSNWFIVYVTCWWALKKPIATVVLV